MKQEEKNTKAKQTETKKTKSKITTDMDDIGFDDKRTETTKVVKKETSKPADKKPTKTVKKTESVKKEETPKTKREIRAEKSYQKKLAREEKREKKAEQKVQRKIAKAEQKEEKRELKKDRVAYIKAKEEEKVQKSQERADKKAKRRENFNEKKENFKQKMAGRKDKRAERKEAKREEKIKRAGMTKEEKRSERDASKIERKAKRSQNKAERSQRKAEKARAIAELKSQGIKVGNSKGMVAAIIAVSIVGGVAVLSSVALAGVNTMYMREIDRSYMQSYYDVVQSANSLTANLAKSSVSTGASGLVSTFSKASTDAFMAEHSLENIPSKDRDMQELTKFFNQVGEFAKTMAGKCVNGEELSEDEKALLSEISKTATVIKEQINKAYAESMHGEHKMHAVSNMFKGEILSDVSLNIGKLSNSTIEYPTMIFDGPFSDARKVSSESAPERAEISMQEAKGILQDKLRVENAEYLTDTNAPNIQTYNFKFEKFGVEVYAQVDKHCGTIVMIDADKRVAETSISAETAEAKAKEYLNIAGFENMVKVWSETSGNTTTFNFAKFENGAIIYPQLVKVKVALSDGAVLGAEGYSYVTNQKERSEKPTLTLSEARSKISKELNVQTEKLAVIPLGNSEKLCYEFMGEKDGQTYFIYINAKTGDQAEIFMVVENPAKGSQII